MPKRTKVDPARQAMHDEMEAIKKRAFYHMVGFNVIRYMYENEADANRHLELGLKLGVMDQGAFYGCPFDPRVEETRFNDKPCFEVQYS